MSREGSLRRECCSRGGGDERTMPGFTRRSSLRVEALLASAQQVPQPAAGGAEERRVRDDDRLPEAPGANPHPHTMRQLLRGIELDTGASSVRASEA